MTTATHNDDHVPGDLEEAVPQPGPSPVPTTMRSCIEKLVGKFV
jgi:hypothetical protein